MKLADWRKSQNLTQARLAKMVGLAAPTISQIENGVRRPGPDVARRIEAASNGMVSAAGLLGLRPERGLREEPVEFDGKPLAQLQISLPRGLFDQANAYNLDIAALILEGGKARLEEEVRRVFRERNAKALDWSRRQIAEFGTFAERHGVFPAR